MNIVDKISEYHNVEVEMWADELVKLIEKPCEAVEYLKHTLTILYKHDVGGNSSATVTVA